MRRVKLRGVAPDVHEAREDVGHVRTAPEPWVVRVFLDQNAEVMVTLEWDGTAWRGHHADHVRAGGVMADDVRVTDWARLGWQITVSVEMVRNGWRFLHDPTADTIVWVHESGLWVEMDGPAMLDRATLSAWKAVRSALEQGLRDGWVGRATVSSGPGMLGKMRLRQDEKVGPEFVWWE